jgi:hypothetical protein
MSTTDLCKTPRARTVLDDAHIGDIRGALGTIRQHDTAPRRGWWTRLRTLLAILGPGLIVMAGDNGLPTSFLGRAWREAVLSPDGGERRIWEAATLLALRDRLRAGDIWVEGSRVAAAK